MKNANPFTETSTHRTLRKKKMRLEKRRPFYMKKLLATIGKRASVLAEK